MIPASLSLFCQVRCYSHTLNEAAFRSLASPDCTIKIRDVTASTFFLEVQSSDYPTLSKIEEFAAFGSYSLSFFLMALNIGSLGYFDWAAKTQATPIYALFNHDMKEGVGIGSGGNYTYPAEAVSPLTETDIQHAILVFGALSKEDDKNVRLEYLKGLYHHGLDYFDVSFRKEAFANFYRSFEFFVTNRFLKAKKLSNELKQFREVLQSLNLKAEIVQMFAEELYRLRSEQVMHSQRKQIEIEWEQVDKMKYLTDVTMQAFYRPIWEEDFNAGNR